MVLPPHDSKRLQRDYICCGVDLSLLITVYYNEPIIPKRGLFGSGHVVFEVKFPRIPREIR